MLLLLLLIANTFGLDAVLGAFLAGLVLRRWAPGDVHSLKETSGRRVWLLYPNILRNFRNEP